MSVFEKNKYRVVYIGNSIITESRIEKYSKDIGELTSYKTSIDAYLGMIKFQGIKQAVIFYEQETLKKSITDFSKLIKSDSRFQDAVVIGLEKVNTTFNELNRYVDDYIDLRSIDAKYNIRLNFLLKHNALKCLGGNIKSNLKEYSLPTSKRMFDVVFALTALVILSPLFFLTMLALRIESKGPLFYASKRVGTGYKIFDFYKFRSMYVDADKMIAKLKKTNNQYSENNTANEIYQNCTACVELGKACSPILYIDGEEKCEKSYLKSLEQLNENAFVKIKDDPRITRVGKIIRNLSIDELPQIINVLKGDMSIVGNRPLPLYEAELLTTDRWSERFIAPAGITGLWQVEKRGGGEMSSEERKELDNTYAKSFGIWYDIKLIMRTFPALLQTENV